MIKVVLVDDEPFLLEMLENTIIWKDFDMTVVGAFYNGRQALEYLEANEADVVISDIVMPVMGGMELLQNLKKINSPVEFVVLSAYSEFELVRDFFRTGIFDYLTKVDIDSEQTANVLSRLRQEIMNKRMSGNKEQRILYYFQTYLQERKFEKEKQIILLSLSVVNRNYLLEFNDFIRDMGGDCGGACYNSNDGEAVILICDQNFTERIDEAAARISTVPFKILGGASTAGSAGQIEGLLGEARKGSNYSFYTESFLISYETVPAGDRKGPAAEPAVLDMCKDYIKSDRSDINLYKIRDRILEVFEAYRKRNLSYVELTSSARDLFAYLSCQFRELGIIDAAMEEKSESVLLSFEEADDFKKLKAFFTDYLNLVYSGMHQEGTGSLIGRIRIYIDSNYDKNLHLKEIARQFGISENYLSRVFSKENNMTFKRYVNVLKIEKAKDYLSNTGLRIGEICGLLGYQNVEHFSRSFKEETGFSPTEYRNMSK